MKNSNLKDQFFNIRRSIRYHDHRRGYFEFLHKLTNFMTILMAGSILYDIGRTGQNACWLTALSVVAAIMAATDMVIGFSNKAQVHQILKSKFIAIESSLLLDQPPSPKEVERKILEIESDEPPIHEALNLVCFNEQIAADGFIEKNLGSNQNASNKAFIFKLKWYHRLTRHIYPWHDLPDNLEREDRFKL